VIPRRRTAVVETRAHNYIRKLGAGAYLVIAERGSIAVGTSASNALVV
jgi:hypothetical protein